MKVHYPSAPSRQPTKKEKARFKKWAKYLSDSKLTQNQIYERAASYSDSGRSPY